MSVMNNMKTGMCKRRILSLLLAVLLLAGPMATKTFALILGTDTEFTVKVGHEMMNRTFSSGTEPHFLGYSGALPSGIVFDWYDASRYAFTGTAQPGSVGTYTITLTDQQDNSTKNIKITVAKGEQTVECDDLQVLMGDNAALAPRIVNGNSAEITGLHTPTPTFSNGDDPTVATVEASGQLTLLKQGTTTVKIDSTATDSYEDAPQKVVSVTVSAAQPTVSGSNTFTGTVGAVGDKTIAVTVADSYNENIDFTCDIGSLQKTASRSGNGDVSFIFPAAEMNALEADVYDITVSAAATTNNDAIASTKVGELRVQNQVATPAANPAGGAYTSAQSVTLSCATANTTIYYTLDGSDPTTNPTKLTYVSAITVPMGTTLKAYAAAAGMTDSSVMTESYAQMGTVATPTANPAGGVYASAQSVTLSCATANATIYYTLDGSDPTTNPAKWTYASAITVPMGTTLKAYATVAGMTDSAIMTQVYAPTESHNPINPPTGPVSPYNDALFTFGGDYADLLEIRLNGHVLDQTDKGGYAELSGYPSYASVLGKVESGSVKVTLYKEFLKTLPNGVYSLTASFNDGGEGALDFEIERPTNNGTSSSGGSSSGDSSDKTAAIIRQTEYIIDGPEMQRLIAAAKTNGRDFVRASSSLPTTVKAAAWKLPVGYKFVARSTVDAAVQVQLTFPEPTKLTSDMKVSGYVKGSVVDSRRAMFEKWFGNKVRVIHLEHAGSFGQTVEIAGKVDLTGVDTSSLLFYSYDKSTNSYKQIKEPNYWLDKSGYLHFTTEFAGDIIISEGPLMLRG